MEYKIPFGRWLWDADLALDPARFNNLQVIVDVDEALGGSTPTASTIAVNAMMFDAKKVSPVGCLVARQHYTYSLVSSGIETIDLPTDRAIKMLILMSVARTKATNSQFANLKISEDNDKKIWFDDTVSYLLKHLQGELPAYTERVLRSVTAASASCFVTPCYEEYASIGAILDIDTDNNAVPQFGGQLSVGGSGNNDLALDVTGWSPHGSIGIETGDPWDMADWFYPRMGMSLKAFVTGGAAILATSTAQMVLQTLRKY
jgi:hypothetical protein